MSEDNFAIGLVNYICPICGKVVDNVIIMNERLNKKNAEEIRKAHGKAIGYSENACEKCASHKDDCVYVIEIDTEKSEPNNPYRTGKYWGIVKDFALFVDHPEYIITTKNGVSFCFMDKEVTHKLGFYV